MGGIVKNWITNKLGLEIPHAFDPAAFRYEVANGILIAEILRKYGLLSDDEFVSLRHSNSTKSRDGNMQHVHKWLTQAGMNLSYDLMLEIAKESPGCAVKFLYELFLWLENGPRKPNIGDKAKKYLTDPDRNKVSLAPKEGKSYKKGEERLSVLSSTWLNSLKAQSSQPGLTFDMSVPIHVKSSKKPKKLPNWYCSLDPPTKYQHAKSDPYNELSEAAQAEAVYFNEQIVDIFKRQANSRKDHQTSTDAIEVTDDEDNVQPDATLPLVQPKYKTKAEIHQERITQANLEERLNALQEIKRFDKKLKQKKRQGITNTTTTKFEKVYRNGKGSKEELQNSVRLLKCRRQKEVRAGIDRSNCRKKAISRIIQVIPSTMFEHMQDDILNIVAAFSTTEKVFADFIHNGHQEKILFKQHACYEAIQKQNARNFDLAKSLQIEHEEKELKRSVLEYKYEQPLRANDDKDQEEVRKSLLVEKLSLVDDIVSNILDLVGKVGDYRLAMGSAMFGTDVFNEAIETGKGVQSKIVLMDEEKFVLEPKESESADDVSYPPVPKPPTTESHDYTFLPKHSAILLDAFLQVANGNLIQMKAFTSILEDLILISKRGPYGESPNECLPQAWLKLSSIEIKKVVYYLMAKQGVINWRNFIIATLDIKLPSQTELILTLKQFQQYDLQGFFLIDKTAFDSISFWFEPTPPCDLSEAFQALHLRECIFYMFADNKGSFFYIDFLLYFCKDMDVMFGIAKGLAVLTGCIILTDNIPVTSAGNFALLLTESDLELLFDKAKIPPPANRGSQVPPNTPMRQRMAEIRSSKTNISGETDIPDGSYTVNNLRYYTDSDGFSTTKSVVDQRNKPNKSKHVVSSLLLETDSAPASAISNLDGLPETDTIPSEAFLQAMWFGNITAYPAEDSSFASHEYQKLKEFVDIAYEETYEKMYDTPDMYEEVYNAPVKFILQHPFIAEILQRYITYKSVDLRVLLTQVIEDTELDLLMESPLMSEDDLLDDSDSFSETDTKAKEGEEGDVASVIADADPVASVPTTSDKVASESTAPAPIPEAQQQLPLATTSVSVPSNPAQKGLRTARKAKSNNPAQGKRKA